MRYGFEKAIALVLQRGGSEPRHGTSFRVRAVSRRMQTLATSSRGAIAPRRTTVALARRGSAASVPASPASSRAPRSFFPRCVFRHVNRRARATRPAPRALNVPEPETLPEDSADEILAKVQRVKSLKKMRARHLAAAERNLGADEDAAFAASLSRTNRNLALEMVRVTESAAVAAARWLGKGDKLAADAAAVEAMRDHLSVVEFIGRVVIGEGEKDQAPMLANGETVGAGCLPHADIAVDPLDGTSLVAGGRGGAISVIAVAESGAMYDPGAAFYMDKICVGPGARGHVDITKSPTINVHAIARALRKSVGDVTCVVLDRERHVGLVEELRLAGARIKLISDGDVEAALAVCDPESGVDALFGVGGSPEGVIAAAAMRCTGGEIQGMLWPRDAADAAAIRACGNDVTAVLTTEDLCGGDAVLFAATGVSDGSLLRGVRFAEFGAASHSLVTRAPSMTIRKMETRHVWPRDKKSDGTLGPR